MLQECNPHLPTNNWKVAKVKEHKGDVHQAVMVLNKESVAPIETARGVLNSALAPSTSRHIRGDFNAAGSSAGHPAEQVLAEEARGGPEDAYSTDSSLSREMRALGPAIEDVDLSDTEEANVTVVEVAVVNVNKTSQINLHHSKSASAALLLRLTEGGAHLVLVQEPWVVGARLLD